MKKWQLELLNRLGKQEAFRHRRNGKSFNEFAQLPSLAELNKIIKHELDSQNYSTPKEGK